MSVDRISGQTATVQWIPLTPDETKGVLVQLQIAYYKSINNTECSEFNCNDCNVMYLKGNLFLQSEATISDLQPDSEYCVAIEVSTINGRSGYSNPIKMTCK